MQSSPNKTKKKWGVGQYLPEPQVDETNRTLVVNALSAKFDSDGYKRNAPLQKDIYHTDPYITCSYCNELTFVDVITIQRMLALPANVSYELGLPPESLPPCLGCKRVDCFHVGPHDFSHLIANRKKKEEDYERLKNRTAAVIQARYRLHLRRMYGAAFKYVLQADYFYKHNAALKITALARGRLGRRIAGTERCLKIIKMSHPLLIKYALKTEVGKQKTFWYKRQIELDLLYRNYIELVQKTGFQPARLMVEKNIQEISIRILIRKNVLIVLVQRRWRGFMARRIVKFFSSEVTRLFQSSVSRVLKLQRVYRGHRARLLIPKLKYELRRERMMDSYLNKGHDHLTTKMKTLQLLKVKNAYVKERREELTCRYTSKIEEPSAHEGNKMKAFWSSCYADNKLGSRISDLLETEQQIVDNKEWAIDADRERKTFLYNIIASSGPSGYGLRGVSKSVIEGILSDKREQQVQQLLTDELTRRETLKNSDNNSSQDDESSVMFSSSGLVDNKKIKSFKDDEQLSVVSEASTGLSSLQFAILLKEMQQKVVPFDPFYITADEITEKTEHLETFGLVFADSSRMRGMRLYFQDELQQITANFIERINKNEVVRASGVELLSKFKEHNDNRLAAVKPQVRVIDMGPSAVAGQSLRKSVSATPLTMTEGQSSLLSSNSGVSARNSLNKTNNSSVQQFTPPIDNKAGKKSQLLNKGYKFPTDINFKAMEWLYDDDAV